VGIAQAETMLVGGDVINKLQQIQGAIATVRKQANE
jgi:hypothetical protein